MATSIYLINSIKEMLPCVDINHAFFQMMEIYHTLRNEPNNSNMDENYEELQSEWRKGIKGDLFDFWCFDIVEHTWSLLEDGMPCSPTTACLCSPVVRTLSAPSSTTSANAIGARFGKVIALLRGLSRTTRLCRTVAM